MSSTSNPEAVTKKITARVVEVVAEKGEGYTLIVELPPHARISSEENWKVALPGDFVGATRLDSLWHLYYREKPPFSSGDTFEISFEPDGNPKTQKKIE
jgi:hypothetical protein